jgi:hypothetical protein
VSDGRLERLLRLIADTREQELSCTECFDQLAPYVDAEADGRDAAAVMPALAQHLRQCGVCREEYETLRDLARADDPPSPPHP